MAMHRLQKLLRHTLGIVIVLIVAWMSVRIPTSIYADTSIIYVNATATGAHTGTSWDDAYADLQLALTRATAGQAIWVAKGTYTPVRCAPSCTVNDRRASFMLKDGVAIYGGFVGDEVGLDQRNIAANPTILSGDLLGNDDPYNATNNDNSIHVVRAYEADGSVIFDGFTITGGNANGTVFLEQVGGGISNIGGSATLTNLILRDNYARLDGGGMYNLGSNSILSNLAFINNRVDDTGGGMSNTHSAPTLTNIAFNGNAAVFGGGMSNTRSTPTLINVTFSDNVAGFGGGMSNTHSTPTLTNTIFSGNIAASGGGMTNDGSNPTLTNSTFSGNRAQDNGGIFNANKSNPTIHNSILWGNLPNEVINDTTSSTTVSSSIVQGGYAGANNLAADPLFVAPVPAAPSTGGDLRLSFGSPAISSANNAECPTADHDGRLRPSPAGSACDIGAYESNLEATMISLSISPNPIVNAQPVTLQAQIGAVAPSTRVPSGQVQFYDQATALGAPIAVDAQGLAHMTIDTLPIGTHIISAAYLGDLIAFFNPSIAAPLNLTVKAYGRPSAIAATAGTPQSAVILTRCATPLQARVVDAFGNGVPNVAVVFSVPSTTNGSFVGGVISVTATTDGTGLATAPDLTAGKRLGAFTVTATTSGVATPASFTLTNLPPS